MATSNTTTIRLVGVPMDLGAGRRGVDMGPSAIRIAGVHQALADLGFQVADDGDVAVPTPESRKLGDPKACYLSEIYHVCNRLRLRVRRTLEAGELPVVLGGDHSVAIGTVSGVTEFYRGRDQELGLIWVDAHADMNTPDSTPSGNVQAGADGWLCAEATPGASVPDRYPQPGREREGVGAGIGCAGLHHA
jgi:arginase